MLIDLFIYIPPMLLKVENQEFQKEINQANILKADLSIWKVETTLENNIHLIGALTLLLLSVVFFLIGIVRLSKSRKH